MLLVVFPENSLLPESELSVARKNFQELSTGEGSSRWNVHYYLDIRTGVTSLLQLKTKSARSCLTH